MKRTVPVVLILVLVVNLVGCTSAPTILGLLFAFRKAEHVAMTSPYLQSRITDVATQTKINALEADVDMAYNCLFSAYENAAKNVPEGQPVNVTFANWGPCAAQGWNAAYQIIVTVRAFDPNFLAGKLDFNVADVSGKTVTLSYDPVYFQSPNPPVNLAPVPVKGAIVVGR